MGGRFFWLVNDFFRHIDIWWADGNDWKYLPLLGGNSSQTATSLNNSREMAYHGIVKFSPQKNGLLNLPIRNIPSYEYTILWEYNIILYGLPSLNIVGYVPMNLGPPVFLIGNR